MAKTSELGRTLIEILGILIIIGLFTTSGFVLYAKAINNSKTNYLLEQALMKHVELQNGDTKYRGVHHKVVDVSRNTNKLSYGFNFDRPTVNNIPVTGTFSKGICSILKKRFLQNATDYKSLVGISIDGVPLSKTFSCVQSHNITFFFNAAGRTEAPGGDRDRDPDDCPEGSKLFGTNCIPCDEDEEECCPGDRTPDGNGNCICPSDKPMFCKGKCWPLCSGHGQSGERDSNDCSCLCEAGTVCECPAGYTLYDGACRKLTCTGNGRKYGEQPLYNCTINGKICASQCTFNGSLNYNDGTCRGYCEDVCPSGSVWGNSYVNYCGFGCIANNGTGLYCARAHFSRISGINGWICAASAAKPGDTCCMTNDFPNCQYGSCDSSVCNVFNGSFKTIEYRRADSDYAKGCKLVTNDNKTVYCVPYYNNWICNRNGMTTTKRCGACTTDQIKNKNCGTCFDAFTCPNWTISGTIITPTTITDDSVLGDICEGEYNGTVYRCSVDNTQCYIGNDNSTKPCGTGCSASSPAGCSQGKCLSSGCPTGTTWTESGQGTTFYGCSSSKNGIQYYNNYRDWAGNPCYYRKNSSEDWKLCAKGCQDSPDCSACLEPIADECTPSGQCRTDGMEIKNCTCSSERGSVSNGHCCPVGHTYVNGDCQILPKPDSNKCYYAGVLTKETLDYGQGTDTYDCQCRDNTKCMDSTKNKPNCIEVTSTAVFKRGDYGECKCKDDTKCLVSTGSTLTCGECPEK